MRASLINPINGIFHNNFYCSTKGVEGTYRTGQTKVPNCLVLTPKHTAALLPLSALIPLPAMLTVSNCSFRSACALCRS